MELRSDLVRFVKVRAGLVYRFLKPFHLLVDEQAQTVLLVKLKKPRAIMESDLSVRWDLVVWGGQF